MNVLTSGSFGLLIAYLLPGFLTLSVLSTHSAMLQTWLGAPAEASPTVGGFLYVTLASVAAGMTVSAVRWLILDSLHHQTGLHPPKQNFSRLQPNLAAFEGVVENHYRYYQFYGNTLITLLMTLFDRDALAVMGPDKQSVIIAAGVLSIVFFFASRDALRKYYLRTNLILGSLPHRQEHRHDQRLARNGTIRRQAER